jgi:hypothetical protein
MPSPYLFLKCVRGDDSMWAEPSRVLCLSELRQLAEADPELRWGLDPRGTIPVKNSDGSISMMKPFEGFSFADTAGAPFHMCYEFYQGISIHPEGEQRVHEKARDFAEKLGAKLFQI